MYFKIIAEANQYKLTEKLLRQLPPFKRMLVLEQTMRDLHKHLQSKIKFTHRNDGFFELRVTLGFIKEELLPLIKLYDRSFMGNAPTSEQTRRYQLEMNQYTHQLSDSLEYYVAIDQAIDAVPSNLWPILKNITINSFITLDISSRTMPHSQRISEQDNNNNLIQKITDQLINLAKIESLNQKWLDAKLLPNEFYTYETEDYSRIHNGMLKLEKIFEKINDESTIPKFLYGGSYGFKIELHFNEDKPAGYVGGFSQSIIYINPDKPSKEIEAFLLSQIKELD